MRRRGGNDKEKGQMRRGLSVVLSMGVKRKAAAAILVLLLLLGSLWLREYVSLNVHISV